MMNSIFAKVSTLSLLASLLLPSNAEAQTLRQKGPWPPADSLLAENDAKVQEGRKRLEACVAAVRADIKRKNAPNRQPGNVRPSAVKQVLVGATVTVAGATLIVYAWPIALAIGAKATVSALIGGGGVITFVGVASLASGVNELNRRAAPPFPPLENLGTPCFTNNNENSAHTIRLFAHRGPDRHRNRWRNWLLREFPLPDQPEKLESG